MTSDAPTIPQPWGLCEFGHQGLLHEEELSNGELIQNRRRELHTRYERMMQPDPDRYIDGANYYLYLVGSPCIYVDPFGNGIATAEIYAAPEPSLGQRAFDFARGVGRGVMNMAVGVGAMVPAAINTLGDTFGVNPIETNDHKVMSYERAVEQGGRSIDGLVSSPVTDIGQLAEKYTPLVLDLATIYVAAPSRRSPSQIECPIAAERGLADTSNLAKPLGRGSTGRTVAANLEEQMAMKQAMSDPAAGRTLSNITMTDSRWPASDGWVKMSQNINGTEVHYVRNTITGAVDDFKFK